MYYSAWHFLDCWEAYDCLPTCIPCGSSFKTGTILWCVYESIHNQWHVSRRSGVKDCGVGSVCSSNVPHDLCGLPNVCSVTSSIVTHPSFATLLFIRLSCLFIRDYIAQSLDLSLNGCKDRDALESKLYKKKERKVASELFMKKI